MPLFQANAFSSALAAEFVPGGAGEQPPENLGPRSALSVNLAAAAAFSPQNAADGFVPGQGNFRPTSVEFVPSFSSSTALPQIKFLPRHVDAPEFVPGGSGGSEGSGFDALAGSADEFLPGVGGVVHAHEFVPSYGMPSDQDYLDTEFIGPADNSMDNMDMKHDDEQHNAGYDVAYNMADTQVRVFLKIHLEKQI